MLAELLTINAYQLMLVFARVGGMLMLMPGIGELAIPARVRLSFALALSLIVMPVVGDSLPLAPAQPIELVMLYGGELLLGIAIGTLARMLISALHSAGTIIAFHSGMGTAYMFDPSAAQQGAIMGAFLTTMGVTLLFVTGLHHLLIGGVVDSYATLPPGAGFPLGDLAEAAVRVASASFKLGLELAMPAVIVAFLILVAMGLMSRLMPQVNVFFVALPIQVAAGLFVFAFTLGSMSLVFLNFYRDTLTALLSR
jgi:flagellar biosynthesis protein FliR